MNFYLSIGDFEVFPKKKCILSYLSIGLSSSTFTSAPSLHQSISDKGVFWPVYSSLSPSAFIAMSRPPLTSILVPNRQRHTPATKFNEEKLPSLERLLGRLNRPTSVSSQRQAMKKTVGFGGIQCDSYTRRVRPSARATATLICFVLLTSLAKYDELLRGGGSTQRLPVCVCLLVFQGVKTLEQTLRTNGPLFDIVEETHAFFQQVDTRARRAWADEIVHKHAYLKAIFEPLNVGQRQAFQMLAEVCSQPYIIVLEEDFKAASHANFEEQLVLGMQLLDEGVNAFRLRSRKFPGEPNYIHEEWLRNGGLNGGWIPKTHLIEHVTWEDAPETHLSELRVCREYPKTWCTSSRNAQYTNNPTLYATSFLRWLVAQVPSDSNVSLEPYLTKFWSTQDFFVAYSDGVFTHERLDRKLGKIDINSERLNTAREPARMAIWHSKLSTFFAWKSRGPQESSR